MKINIAIDGPSAAVAKYTAKILAKRIRLCLSRYRSDVSLCRLLCITAKINIDDEEALVHMMEYMQISFDAMAMFISNDQDVSKEIQMKFNGSK